MTECERAMPEREQPGALLAVVAPVHGSGSRRLEAQRGALEARLIRSRLCGGGSEFPAVGGDEAERGGSGIGIGGEERRSK